MHPTPVDRNVLGRRLMTSHPQLMDALDQFHRWLAEAVERCPDCKLVPVVTDGKLVEIEHPFGSFAVIEEIGRVGEQLAWRVVFCKTANVVRKTPLPFYVISLQQDSAYFGEGDSSTPFEYDPNTDYWMWRNILKLGYELAIAATETTACLTVSR